MGLIAAELRQSLGEGIEVAIDTEVAKETVRMPWEIEYLPIGMEGREIPYKVLPDGRKYPASEEEVGIADLVANMNFVIEGREYELRQAAAKIAELEADKEALIRSIDMRDKELHDRGEELEHLREKVKELEKPRAKKG